VRSRPWADAHGLFHWLVKDIRTLINAEKTDKPLNVKREKSKVKSQARRELITFNVSLFTGFA
jgi:hypothetical protein